MHSKGIRIAENSAFGVTDESVKSRWLKMLSIWLCIIILDYLFQVPIEW
jgi:hypothetical protein